MPKRSKARKPAKPRARRAAKPKAKAATRRGARRGAPARSAGSGGAGLLRVRQVRSGIGRPPVHRRTLEALGLHHHQAVVVHRDHPAIRGMLNQVRHLVEVTPVTGRE